MPAATTANHRADASTRERHLRCIVSADGLPIGCDRAWETFTGADAARLRESGWEHLLLPDDRAGFVDAWRQSARTALPFDVDLRLRRADGAFRWCQFSGEPTLSSARAAHEHPRWIVHVVDIHRHKLAQEALEHTLREREESLAHFAHDLRNPVQTMRHALFALSLDGAAAESRPQMLSVLERQVELITRRTQDYLHELQEAREP